MNIILQKLKPFFAALLILAVTSQLLIYPIIVNAQTKEATLASAALRCLGIGLGAAASEARGLVEGLDPTKVPVRDSATRSEIRAQSCEDFKDKALALLSQTLREILRKRILDALVDQTINWIQGGDSPKFVTDFGGFLEDAAQAAAGDVAREVGLGQLCTGINPARIRVQLETPVFSQRVSCTLDDIVGNISRFGQNFTSGGFIAYQELLKPANNRWGIEILTLNELEKRTAQKQDVLRQEIAVGSGFLSTTKCLEWTLYADFGGRVERLDPPVPVNNAFDYPDPKSPPPILDNTQEWKCTKSQVTTPGRLIADATTNALNIHSNFLVSAEDLTGYAAAIIDAGINRVIKEGFEGILGVPVSAPPTGFNSANLPSEVTEAADVYTDTREEQGASGVSSENLLQTIDDAEQSLINASVLFVNASSVNNDASSTAASLIDWCRITTFPAGSNASRSPQSCATASRILNETENNETEFENRLEEINDRAEDIPSLRNAASNPPTDSNELQALVDRITGFAQNASILATAASGQLSAVQATLQQANDLLNACTDSDEVTQCP